MAGVGLTPFGFTPTEERAYAALLDLGPATGYAVARALGIARANSYQALEGLVGKGGAVFLAGRPGRYRAVQPQALLNHIAAQEAQRLDALEREIRSLEQPSGAEGFLRISGVRSLQEIVLRTAVRTEGAVVCLVAPGLVGAFNPLWHKRQSDELPTELFLVGAAPEEGGAPVPVAGVIGPALASDAFGSPLGLLLSTEDAGVLATGSGSDLAGYWTSEPALVGALRLAMDALVATAS